MDQAKDLIAQKRKVFPRRPEPEALYDDDDSIEGTSIELAGDKQLLLDPGKAEHWSAIETRSLIQRIRRQSAREQKKNEESFEEQEEERRRLQQDQPGVEVCGRSPADQQFFDFMKLTTREALDVADDAIADSVTEIKRLTDQHSAATAKLQAEIAHLKDQLASTNSSLHTHLDTIVSKLDSSAVVANATLKLVTNSTAAINELIKDVLGVPIFKAWAGWAKNLWNGDIPADASYFVPSSWLQWMEPQWPMSLLTHILTWLTAYADNRGYSRFAKKFNVHVPGKFRVFS